MTLKRFIGKHLVSESVDVHRCPSGSCGMSFLYGSSPLAPFGLDFRKPKNVGTQHYTRVAMMIGMGMWMWMMMMIMFFCDNCCCCHFYHYYNTACLLSGFFFLCVYTFVIQYYVLLLPTFIVITVVLLNYGRSVGLSLEKSEKVHAHCHDNKLRFAYVNVGPTSTS